MLEVTCLEMFIWRDCERGSYFRLCPGSLYLSSNQVGKKPFYRFDAVIMQNSEVVIRAGAVTEF